MSAIRGLNYSVRSSASHSPGALQSAQISVDGRSFILEDIFQAIKVLKTKQPCLLGTNRSMNLNFLFRLNSFFDSQEKIMPAYFWSALKESVMRCGYRLSSLTGRLPPGRSSNVPRNVRQLACYVQSVGVVTDTHCFSTTVRKRVTELLSLLFSLINR